MIFKFKVLDESDTKEGLKLFTHIAKSLYTFAKNLVPKKLDNGLCNLILKNLRLKCVI